MTPFRQSVQAYRHGSLGWTDLMLKAVDATASVGKDQGAVYTPKTVVDALIEGLRLTPDDVVLEPSCGRGAFVVPVLETIAAATQWNHEAMLAWMDTHLDAVDIDPHAVDDLRAVLSAWFFRTYGVDIPEDRFHHVHHHDALAWPRRLAYTAVVGNPPYVRFQNLPLSTRTHLAQTFTSCASGNVDIYYAFLEKALTWGQRIAFVVPHGFLTTRSGRALRALLNGSVERIVDYGAERVFPGVGTYVALVFLNTQQTSPAQPVYHNPSGTTSTFQVDAPKPRPVRSCTPGIATLCDAAYAVERQQDGTFRATMTNLPVEAAFVRPLVKITTIHKHSPARWTAFVLFPYGPDKKPIPPHDLARHAPLTWAHLLAVKDRLDARDKGDVAGYPQWYAYGRSQGLTLPQADHVLVVPAMVGGKSQPKLFDTRPLAPFGRPVFSSGYVVDAPTPGDMAALLSPGFLDAAAQIGSPRPGKDKTYYSVASSLVKTYAP